MTIAEVAAALASSERPVSLDKARLERQIKALAAENADDQLDDEVYLGRKRELRAEIDALERSARPGIPATRAVEWLRALSATWQAADVDEEKAELLHVIYDRIVGGRREDRLGSAHPRCAGPRHGPRASSGGNGAPDRIRTCDLRLRRPTLYPLSYRRAASDDTG